MKITERDTALDFTAQECQTWDATTQAVSILAGAHFDLFNELESGKRKKRATYRLGTLYRAAKYLRNTCPTTSPAYWDKP